MWQQCKYGGGGGGGGGGGRKGLGLSMGGEEGKRVVVICHKMQCC